MSRRVSVLAIGLISIFLVSCSGDSPNNTTGDGPVESLYDVEYQDNTILFSEDDDDVLIDADTTTGVFTFDASYFDADPESGDVIIVGGKTMRKVKSVRKEGGNLVVDTEDAVLTDAIKNGTVAWSLTPEWGDLGSIKWGEGEVQNMDNSVLTEGDTVMFEIERSGVRHVVQIIPKSVNGSLSVCDFIFQMTKEAAGKVTVVFLAKGEMSIPKQETEIIIKDGKVDDVRSNHREMKCDLELSLSAAGAKGGSHSLVLPGAALQFPIRYLPGPGGVLIPNPIPMSIGIGIQFVTQMTMPSAESSAMASAKLSISSDAGFEYHGTTVSSSAKLNNEEIKDGNFDAAALIGVPVDVQFGVTFPRVSLNIVGKEFAYVHTGFTTGAAIQWGPVCKSGYAKMVVEGGYNFGFLGLPLIGQKETFVEREKKIDCE